MPWKMPGSKTYKAGEKIILPKEVYSEQDSIPEGDTCNKVC